MYNNCATGLRTVVTQTIEQNKTKYFVQNFYLCAPETMTWNVQYVESFCENKIEMKQNVVIFHLVIEDTKYCMLN